MDAARERERRKAAPGKNRSNEIVTDPKGMEKGWERTKQQDEARHAKIVDRLGSLSDKAFRTEVDTLGRVIGTQRSAQRSATGSPLASWARPFGSRARGTLGRRSAPAGGCGGGGVPVGRFPLPLPYKGPTSLSYLGFAGEDACIPSRV